MKRKTKSIMKYSVTDYIELFIYAFLLLSLTTIVITTLVLLIVKIV